MKHSSTRELFNYWNMRRGGRAAPERGEIEPTAIRRVLADTFMLDVDPRRGHPFRIAGTRVCALFGRELKGQAFTAIWAAESREQLREVLANVATETIGVVAGAATIGGGDVTRELELLLLPLAQRTASPRVLGALVPTEPPAWLGAETLCPLSLGTTRYLGPESGPYAGPRRRPLAPGHARIRHGLVVYDGGHA
jgi:hypothetical protein